MLVSVIVAVILAGLAVWILSQLPLDATIVRIGRVIIIAALVLWLVGVFFGFPSGWAPHGWRS
jgi:hypothetical membrane protein